MTLSDTEKGIRGLNISSLRLVSDSKITDAGLKTLPHISLAVSGNTKITDALHWTNRLSNKTLLNFLKLRYFGIFYERSDSFVSPKQYHSTIIQTLRDREVIFLDNKNSIVPVERYN